MATEISMDPIWRWHMNRWRVLYFCVISQQRSSQTAKNNLKWAPDDTSMAAFLETQRLRPQLSLAQIPGPQAVWENDCRLQFEGNLFYNMDYKYPIQSRCLSPSLHLLLGKVSCPVIEEPTWHETTASCQEPDPHLLKPPGDCSPCPTAWFRRDPGSEYHPPPIHSPVLQPQKLPEMIHLPFSCR